MVGAIALPASAAEWSMRVGGFMEQYVAFATSDFDDKNANPGDFDGIDSKQDAEIWFLPSITLDNGIKIGANIQLEALTGGDQIDEAQMIITGSFGRVILGSENSAGYKMTYAAPDVTFINLNSGSTTLFIPWSGGGAGSDLFRGTLNTTYIENSRNNDAQRFSYFTPRFSGLQIGLSYARDGLQDDNAQVDDDIDNGGFPTDIFDIGANYVNSFDGFDIAVSGRWGTANDHSGPDATIWSGGLNLGFGGFTIGGSYAEQNHNSSARRNGFSYDLGASYTTGPWGVSFTYQHGNNQGNVDPDGTAEVGRETSNQYLVGLSYDLAKGVNLGAYGAYVDFNDADGGDSDDSIDGFIIGTGIKIKF